MTFARAKWRHGPLSVGLADWRPPAEPARVVVGGFVPYHDRQQMRDAGSFRVRLVAVSLAPCLGTGDITRERPWRRDALANGWAVV